jgi:hypothetical protein
MAEKTATICKEAIIRQLLVLWPDLVFSSMRARVRFSRGRLFLAAAVVAAPVVAAPVLAASKWPADLVLRWSTVPSSTKEIQQWKN